jgi:hypothetical protein
MSHLNKQFFSNYLPFFYVLFFYFVFFSIYFLGGIDAKFTNENFIKWDTIWYERIMKSGYFWNPNEQSSVAFFPFFPFLWRFSHLSPIGVSVLNAFAFAGGATVFFRQFEFKTIEKFYLLSMPCLMFCFIPYTEACGFSCLVPFYLQD